MYYILHSNLYKQLRVQIKNSTFSDTIQDWYLVKTLPFVPRVDSNATTFISLKDRTPSMRA